MDDIVENGFVYGKINKTWFGLKQGNKITHSDLIKHLKQHGYFQAENTNGLFVHKLWDILFMLVVDDFGIKFTSKDDVDHLISVMGLVQT